MAAVLLAPLARHFQRAAAVPALPFCEVRILRDYNLFGTSFAGFCLITN